jgi:ribose transport system substrate-binding protein
VNYFLGRPRPYLQILLVTCFLAGCNRRPSGPIKLAFIVNDSGGVWSEMARKGCEQAAKESGNVQLEFRDIPGNSLTLQKKVVVELLNDHVAGIAISPLNPTLQSEMLNQTSRRAVVITQDSDAPGSNRAMYIGTDNRAAGQQLGSVIRRTLPSGSKIAIFVGNISAQNASARFQGIQDELAGTGIQIAHVLSDGPSRDQAKVNAAEVLAHSPDVTGLIGLWNYNGPAILKAVEEAHKAGKVKIICFDEDPVILEGIKNGSVTATIVQQPYEFGYQAIKTMAAIVRGDRSVIPPEKQVFVPTLVIDQNNIDQFLERIGGIRKQ